MSAIFVARFIPSPACATVLLYYDSVVARIHLDDILTRRRRSRCINIFMLGERTNAFRSKEPEFLLLNTFTTTVYRENSRRDYIMVFIVQNCFFICGYTKKNVVLVHTLMA